LIAIERNFEGLGNIFVSFLLKPMWLSLIWRKLRSVADGNESPAFAIWARVFDASTPPLTVQSRPVPAKPCIEESRGDRSVVFVS